MLVPSSVQPVSAPTSPPAQSRISSVHVPAGPLTEPSGVLVIPGPVHWPAPVLKYWL